MLSLHTPAEQEACVAQVSFGGQVVPSATFEVVQPVAGLQASVVHGFRSSQALAAPPRHTPFLQASATVQAFPSSQMATLVGLEQPVASLQTSSVHALLSLHTAALTVNTHPVVALQVLAVQSLPSSHAPLLGVWTQPVVALQLSVVHATPSLQVLATPAAQAPWTHWSFTVHALPSLHAPAVAVYLQPDAGSQLSVVHGLLSLQGAIAVNAHPVVALQVSAVHASPSAHRVFCGV